jgi:hypothetical protein
MTQNIFRRHSSHVRQVISRPIMIVQIVSECSPAHSALPENRSSQHASLWSDAPIHRLAILLHVSGYQSAILLAFTKNKILKDQ